MTVLTKGFGNRISHLHIEQPQRVRWKPNKKLKQNNTLVLGLNLDETNYFRALDKANESEVQEFQELWGSRSELRRFKDGTITDAVIWDAKNLAERRLICKQILTYLVKTKFKMEETDFLYIADQLEQCVPKTSEEQTLEVLEAYDQLAKNLRELDDLPLGIVSVQGSSPVFRYELCVF